MSPSRENAKPFLQTRSRAPSTQKPTKPGTRSAKKARDEFGCAREGVQMAREPLLIFLFLLFFPPFPAFGACERVSKRGWWECNTFPWDGTSVVVGPEGWARAGRGMRGVNDRGWGGLSHNVPLCTLRQVRLSLGFNIGKHELLFAMFRDRYCPLPRRLWLRLWAARHRPHCAGEGIDCEYGSASWCAEVGWSRGRSLGEKPGDESV